ncbi:MAG TPA: glycosyltransferase 87 family protein [Candidatus Eisenbacteria bacterium]|nr:glycosyltransferase 87 family protein [Candidatus Eisenbacteria bacterium]
MTGIAVPRRIVIGRLALAGLAVIGALAGLGVVWIRLMSDPLGDAQAYYDAANRLNAGLALYPPDADPDGNRIYLYPPLLAIALRPLALLPYPAFALVWEGLVIASFALLLDRLGLNRRTTWLALGILGIPVGWALAIAQAHVPLTLLLALSQPWSIALAANIKIFPALAAVYWLGRRDSRSCIAFLVWLVVLGLMQLAIEPEATRSFFASVGLAQLGHVRNISPFVVSPILWALLLIAGTVVAVRLAPSRWGWFAAVALATLSSPRLLVYMLMGLLAGLRRPRASDEVAADKER